MKRTIFFVLTITCAFSLLGQGTVVFNNRFGSATTHVWAGGWPPLQGNSSIDVPSGTTVYPGILIGTAGGPAASAYFAALLGAAGPDQNPATFQQANGTTTFRTGAGAGNIAQTTATFFNIPPDAQVATIQMVAWDNSSGFYSTWALAWIAWQNGLIGAGRSAPFNLSNIGGTVNTPPNLVGLTSFSITIVPEPSAVGLVGMCSALLLLRRRSGT